MYVPNLNIVYHHRTQGTGAEGVHIAYIVKGLRELGHQVKVVSPNPDDPTKTAGDNPFAKKEGQKGGFLRRLSRSLPQFLFEMLEVGYNFSAVRQLTKAISDKKIDFIYERQAFFMYAGAKVAKKFGIPFIVEVNEVAGQARVRKQIFVGLAKKIERFVFETADAIFVVSQFLKDKIVELGIEADKIHVIPNGADETLFRPDVDVEPLRQTYKIGKDTVVVGFVGWFVAWHNLTLLLKAFAHAAKNRNACLLLVGDGTLKEELQNTATELGIADRVIFPGAVPYENIPRYVNLMNICVIPGSNEYRSPIKMFEYMLMGKAVLAPRFHPIFTVIEHNQDGVIFEPDNEQSMTTELEILLNDSQKRKHLGQKAREKVLNQYLWSHNVQRVLNIYESVSSK